MSYCRWSSRCEDGKSSDVYAYLNVSGGVSVHVGTYRPRLWIDSLRRLSDWAMDLGGDSWYKTGETETNAHGFTWDKYKQRGRWYRTPIRVVSQWLQHPRIGTRLGAFWWPHSWTHYPIPGADVSGRNSDLDRSGLDWESAILHLLMLRGKGYWVPEYAITRLREEEREDPDGWQRVEEDV